MDFRFASGVKGMVFAMACAAMLTARADVTVTQAVTLYSGWNAVYLEVSPSVPLAEVFGDMTIKRVSSQTHLVLE